jgi:prepilin peptidase CpaA
MIISALALLVFPAIMIFAAASDLLTMRISNLLVLVLLASFVLLAVLVQLPLQELVSNLICAIVVLAIAFAFFAFGWIGGGDAKLAAGIGLWLGSGLMLQFGVYTALLGGALTLVILALRRWPLPAGLRRIAFVEQLHDPKKGVPYGVALAAAALLVYPMSSIFQSAMAA